MSTGGEIILSHHERSQHSCNPHVCIGLTDDDCELSDRKICPVHASLMPIEAYIVPAVSATSRYPSETTGRDLT